ncbi:MAG: prepilin peptidase [Verrucomicrobia bacterium]|nr:prepilin peptidase [Verrucomicrobiota bacterium]
MTASTTVGGLFVFILGACIGSFLNVAIYRLPRDLSVNRPRRSFCPNCGKQIAWRHNLPLVSWLVLRGRCAECGTPIPFRYFAVELITAVLFLISWNFFPSQVAVAYWVFIGLVVAATFIDLEHFIIPDEITLGGVVAGIVAAFIVPQLMSTDARLPAFVRAALAALLGYLLLWFVLEAGKLLFGRKRITLDAPTPFIWRRSGDDAEFTVGAERSLWSEYFGRESDRLLIDCEDASIDGRMHNKVTLEFHYDRLAVENETFALDDLTEITGSALALVIPREAMGRGDLKFLACIGAFLGWRAVLFALFAGSVYGSVIGLITLLLGKRVWSLKLPFGPYLGLGAITWMFFGEGLLQRYQALLGF